MDSTSKQKLADGAVKDAMKGALQLIQAIAEAIRELQELPSGKLYAMVMSKIDLATYNRVLEILQKAGVIEVKSDLVRWIAKP